MDFADRFTIKIGGATLVGTRLTIKELRANLAALAGDKFDIDASLKVVKEHVRLEGGGEFDPEDLSQDQMRRLIAELTLPKEGRGISDFIGLLC